MDEIPKKKVASDKNDVNNTIVPILKEVAGRLRFGSFDGRFEVHNGRITKVETFNEHKKHVLKS